MNCLVLGVVGYAFMTDDTRATTDAVGGFSFFRSDDENSFVVKPGKRARTRGSRFDWRREKPEPSRAEGSTSMDFEFPDLGGNLSEPTGASAFLAPGQIDELFKTHSRRATAYTVNQPSMPIFRGSSNFSDSEGQTGTQAFDATLVSPPIYRRYSVSARQTTQAHGQNNSVAVENAVNGRVEDSLRVLKGKLVKVTGQGDRNGVLNLHVAHGPSSEITTVPVKPIGKHSVQAHAYSIDWSGNFASHFYSLEYGFSEVTLRRMQGLDPINVAASNQCAQPCTGTTKQRGLSHNQISKRLQKVADRGAYLIYVVEEISTSDKPMIRAILLQDMADRKWQIIRMKKHAS